MISPDGRWVAYTASEMDWSGNAFVSEIWVGRTGSGKSYRLTSAPKRSPESRRLAFVSNRDGKRQIYVIAPDGGEAANLTQEAEGVRDFESPPGGAAIAFSGTGPLSKARKERDEKYREFTIAGEDYRPLHLWVVKVPAVFPADPKELPTPEKLVARDDLSVGSFAWSPDGSQIAFDATPDPDLSSSGTGAIYIAGVADHKVRVLAAERGPNRNPRWSPDGKQVAFAAADGQTNFCYANRRIAVTSAAGEPMRVLAPDFYEDADLIG